MVDLALPSSLTRWLFNELPTGWYIPPLLGWPVIALASTPAGTVEYRVVVGGPCDPPAETRLYGVSYPPHPLAVELWRLAVESPGCVLVARVRSPGCRATGLVPDEVRRFDIADPELALRWIVDEARLVHAEHAVAYSTGEQSRQLAVVAANQRVESARREAEALARAALEEKNKVGFTVRRGHRSAL